MEFPRSPEKSRIQILSSQGTLEFQWKHRIGRVTRWLFGLPITLVALMSVVCLIYAYFWDDGASRDKNIRLFAVVAPLLLVFSWGCFRRTIPCKLTLSASRLEYDSGRLPVSLHLSWIEWLLAVGRFADMEDRKTVKRKKTGQSRKEIEIKDLDLSRDVLGIVLPCEEGTAFIGALLPEPDQRWLLMVLQLWSAGDLLTPSLNDMTEKQ